MLMQREKSVEALNYQKGKGRVFDADKPAWRPFQLAFILLNLRGIVTPDSADREIVDLLWFPTGGGKTEAYLGLAAFTMGLRRLRDVTGKRPNASGDGGVTVLMRYTLRLLTIQQFQRAATLLCACEVLRREGPDRLGQQPFSIGLWVGGGATPNHIDQKPDPQHRREPGALQALENFDPKNEPGGGKPGPDSVLPVVRRSDHPHRLPGEQGVATPSDPLPEREVRLPRLSQRSHDRHPGLRRGRGHLLPLSHHAHWYGGQNRAAPLG